LKKKVGQSPEDEQINDEKIVGLVQKAMGKQKAKLWLFEGFPLNVDQGVMFENLIGECQMILNFTGAPETLIENEMLSVNKPSSIDAVMQKINEHNALYEPVLNYYGQFGKLRHIDCAGTVPEVYQKVQNAAMPRVHFVIGAKCSGKHAVADYLAKRAGMSHIDFTEITKSSKEFHDPIKATFELMKRIRCDKANHVIVTSFPETQKQLETYIANSVIPYQLIYINATEDVCMRNNDELGPSRIGGIPSPALMLQVKEYNKKIKPVIDFAKKINILLEIKNSEEISQKQLFESSCAKIKPEIIIVRAHETCVDQYEGVINELVEQGGYMHLDVPSIRKEETARRTKLGTEMLEICAKGKLIPSEYTISMLRNIIYSGDGQIKYVITGFPEEVPQLELFENTCAQITWEFYLYPADETPLTNYSANTIETVMHLSHRLTVTPTFAITELDKYYGENLQYILINGPKVSGKTTIAKSISEKYGYTLLDTNSLTEEVKKKSATEDNPAGPAEVPYEQVLNHLIEKLNKRTDRRQKFVLDIMPLENLDQIGLLFNGIGLPAVYLNLHCPIEYVKMRYKAINQIQDLAEDQNAEIEKGYAFYNQVKEELAKTKDEKDTKCIEINASLTLDKVYPQIEGIFTPKIVLLKSEDCTNNDTIFNNLSVKYTYLYLNAADLIKQNIKNRTKFGSLLMDRKKPKELKKEYQNSYELTYGAIHYDFTLVLKMLKETIEKTRKNETCIIINNLLNSHKLAKAEDQLNARPMDELFLVNKELGHVCSIVSLLKEDYEKTDDIRKAEPLPPKPVEKVEVKKEPAEGEEEAKDVPPPEDEEGKEKKPVFDPYLYSWTNTEGQARTMGQLFTKWKGCNIKNMPISEFQSEGTNMDLVLDKMINMVIGHDFIGPPTFVQIKF